jgi:uroporphyrinogen decarboxylase
MRMWTLPMASEIPRAMRGRLHDEEDAPVTVGPDSCADIPDTRAAASRAETSRFLRACHRQLVDTTPVWLMRQAGRYMAEYRRLRESYSITDMLKTPELACAVTLQPIQTLDVDAAVIFADILILLEAMGLQVEFINGEVPLIHNPIRSAADVDALEVPDPAERLWFTLEAIKLAREELDSRGVPLIGFSGAPFTLVSYALDAGHSGDLIRTKRLMMSDPATWHRLMLKVSDAIGYYLLAQAHAGAQALQLFDSWVGALSPSDYRTCVLPYTRRVIERTRAAAAPIIHFSTDSNGLLELLRDSGSDVISIDWRIDLDTAWLRLGRHLAIQGNLDPVALLAPWPALKERARDVLDQGAGRRGYVFNLGHGILPSTPVDNVRRLVDFVHAYQPGHVSAH